MKTGFEKLYICFVIFCCVLIMNGPFPQSAYAGEEEDETLSTNNVIYTTPAENFRLDSKIEILAIPSFSTIAACSSGNSDISCPPAGFTPNQLDLVYDCKGYSSANPAGGWVLDTARAGHDPVCWQDLRVCYYQGTINELCYEMGTQTIGDTNMQSVNHTEACSIVDHKKKYCVTNYDGSNTVKGDTDDDMFKIMPNANSFMTYKRPGDADLELRYFKRNPGYTHDSMELMLPSGPFSSFDDYRKFLNNPPDYMTIEGACHPTTVRLCEGTVPPPPVINGACGDAAYGGFYSSPPSGGAGGVATTTLCYSGTPSAVTGSGPYEWTCNGLNGGTSSPVCSAAPVVIAQCGSSDGGNFYNAPLSGYCNVGNPSPLSGSGPWTWHCRGAPSPANDDTCTANLIQDGDCGPADGNAYSTAAQVNAAGLCNTAHGSTPSSVSGTGPWSWSCNGTPGGASDSCSARFAPSCPVPPTGGENGTCGTAHGNSFVSMAALNASQLCLTGTATTPSGSPTATWSCTGSGGGNAQACSATITTGGPCTSSGSVHTTANGCTNAGFTSLEDTSYEEVTGPHWSSSGFGSFITRGGYCLQVMPPANSAPLTFNMYRLYAAPSCTPVAGACGPADGTTTSTAPSGAANLCANGTTPTAVSGSGPWTWGCNGLNGGTSTSATACRAGPSTPPGCHNMYEVRVVNGNAVDTINEVCPAGQGVPRAWYPGGYSTVPPCAVCPVPVNGACRSQPGNHVTQPANNTATGCTAGTYADLTTDTPTEWRWRCNGEDGGSPSGTCTAARAPAPINGACRAQPGNHTSQPATNTATGCTAGTYADLTTDTPTEWRWRCNGQNGGSPSGTCTAIRVATPVNGACRAQPGNHSSQPATNTATGCTAGTYADLTTDTPTEWRWRCNGQNGGSPSGTCTATRTSPGTCGNAQHVTYPNSQQIVDAGLCASGTASAVTSPNSSTWAWTCGGTACTAGRCSLGSLGAYGSVGRIIDWDGWIGDGCYNEYQMRQTMKNMNGGTNPPDCGTPAANDLNNRVCISTYGFNGGSCNGASHIYFDGRMRGIVGGNCPPPPANGICGSKSGRYTNTQPTGSEACAGSSTVQGMAYDAAGNSGNGQWNWECVGDLGGSVPSCSAPRVLPGMCNDSGTWRSNGSTWGHGSVHCDPPGPWPDGWMSRHFQCNSGSIQAVNGTCFSTQ